MINRRIRFGLRFLFAAVGVVCVGAAIAAAQWAEHQRKVRAPAVIASLGGEFKGWIGAFASPGTMCCSPPMGKVPLGLDLQSTKVKDDDLVYLRYFPDLEELSLQSTEIGDDGLVHLAKLQNLTALGLAGTRITDRGLGKLAALQKLKTLYVGDTKVTLKAVENLEKAVPGLLVANWESWRERKPGYLFGEVVIASGQSPSSVLNSIIASGQRDNIREVQIQGGRLADDTLEILATFPALRRLKLPEVKLSAHRLAGLDRLGGLEVLDLRHTDAGDADTQPIAKLVHLRELSFDGCAIGDESLERLTPLTSLVLLGLSQTKVSDRSLHVVSRMTRLESLSLYGTATTGGGLRHVSGLAALKNLAIPSRVKGDDFKYLDGLTNLEGFDFGLGSNVQGTDHALLHLAHTKSIQSLNFEFSDITDDGFRAISSFRHLKGLQIDHTRISDDGLAAIEDLVELEGLYASDTQIGDDGLAHLKKLRKLNTLILCNTRITDAGLVHLIGLKSLENLQIPPRISWGAHLEALQTALPNLLIHYH